MKRRLTVLAAVALAVVLVGGAPIATAASKVTYYVSLGDSLAAGYQPVGSDPHFGGSHGYADQLHKLIRDGYDQLQLVKLGCGGESTRTMIEGWFFCPYPEGSQLAQAVAFLEAHPAEVALITIDVGANDFLVDCEEDPACAVEQIAQNLPIILAELRMAAGPDVPVVGMNYYQPGVAQWFTDPTAAQAAAEFVMQFNDFLESLYAGAGSPVADVEVAFAVTDFATMVDTKDFGPIPASAANACDWTWICTGPPLGPDIHANTEGYGVIATAFEEVLPI